MQVQMNKLNNPASYNKSTIELKTGRCRAALFDLQGLLFCLHSSASLSSWFSISLFLLEIFLLIPPVATVHTWTFQVCTATLSWFINPAKGGGVKKKKKGHWAFLESSSKARLCVYRLRRGWAQGCGACSLLQRCLVCHLTVDCRAAISPLSKQVCYIFHLKNSRGHQCVWLCSLKPDGGFPINKCTGSIYTDCGTWRHNTHDTLFSGQSCHKSL